MFPHEQLHVYSKALAFGAAASAFSGTWSKKHAVVDQFDRACESLILNRVDGARLRSAPGKLKALVDHHRFLGVAEGSAMRVAAYLDLAVQRLLLGEKDSNSGKALLARIVAMLSAKPKLRIVECGTARGLRPRHV